MSEDAILEDLEAAERNRSTVDVIGLIKNLNKSTYSSDNDLWRRIACLSIVQRDMDSCLFCITKMKMARVARDVKNEQLRNSDGNRWALAIAAFNFNMLSEAEIILKESGDTNDLSLFYQQINQWEKAIEFADGLHVKNVYYNYAKYLEREGKIAEAIDCFEKSKTYTFEVPRMLFQLEDGHRSLHEYCMKGEDKELPDQHKLMQWWGQFCESQGKRDQALTSYEKAGDYYNLVRLLCFSNQVSQAKSIAASLLSKSFQGDSQSAKTRDAALIFLAKQLEEGNPAEAIEYYLACRAVKQAIRVCKSKEMPNELAKITVNYGSKTDCEQVIREYLSEDEQQWEISPDIVVQLFQSIGDVKRAIEVAVKHRSWKQLRDVTKELLNMNEQQHSFSLQDETMHLVLDALRDDADIIDVAIDLLLVTKGDRVNEVIEKLLIEFNVEISDELVEKVDRIAKMKDNDSFARILSDMALRQGKYIIAAKMLNSQGDRVGSLKALIRSGQTDKVINYANIARDKQVYKIAGNYLQQVNHGDRSLIQTFYKKAGAKDELRRFTETSK
jgi:intraflagellar transport protein 140